MPGLFSLTLGRQTPIPVRLERPLARVSRRPLVLVKSVVDRAQVV